MLITARAIQLFLLALAGALCLTNSIMSLVISQKLFTRKITLFYLEFVTAMLLIADFLSRLYKGEPGQTSFYVTRITSFLLFFLLYAEMFGLNLYLRTYAVNKKGKIPKRLDITMILSAIGSISIIISQFNHMFYYIDDNNVYIRGELFNYSYVLPMAIYLVMVSIIIQYRKLFSKLIFAALIIFAFLPICAGIIQGVYFGTIIFNLSIAIAAEALFTFSLIDQNKYLMKVASEDRMTGLPNSYGYIRIVQKYIAQKQVTKYNAYYFDIVRMGLLNQKYGNEIGDFIILKYTQQINSFTEEDEVIGRLGGNFFVALIRKERTDEFLEYLKNVNVEIDLPSGKKIISVYAVIGGYEINTNNITGSEIMSNISMAVNVAKNVLKKPVVFLTEQLLQEMNDKKQVLENIPKAMQRKELKPYYQPKVNAKSFTLCGGEALVRWEKDGEIIPPYRYIPLMEQNEFICKFDFYMLDYVCKDIREWMDAGLNPPTISVNFSRKNLGNPNLVKEISEVIKSHNIPPNLIQIEITETLDEYSIEHLKGVVKELQQYGMTAAIDDFGTGSSSIMTLKEVPFNVLKIDKSFIDSTTQKDCTILGYIIAMAKAMKAAVICEGVETQNQIDILKGLGCDEIQGYFFDKPLKKDEFEKRMANPQY